MLVSTKGRYALRIIIDLAQHNNSEYIPLKEIASRQEISEKYLESIISILSKAKFVTGQRGKGGGYKLTMPPHKITVLSILNTTEDTIAPIACLQTAQNPCVRANECITLPMWKDLSKLIVDFFNGITIEDLLNNYENANNYII